MERFSQPSKPGYKACSVTRYEKYDTTKEYNGKILPRGEYLSCKLSENRSKVLVQQNKYNFFVFYIFLKIVRINRYAYR